MDTSSKDKQKKLGSGKLLTGASPKPKSLIDSFKQQGGVCMKGNITTRDRCFVCGSNLLHSDKRNGCFCPEHPQVGATTFVVRFGEDIYRRFKNYQQATQFLTGLRYKTGEGSFDPNDYRNENPNGFSNLAERYLKKKEKRKSFSNIKHYIKVAQDHFGDTNVKYINSADIDEFLFNLPNISEKTRANYKSTLSDFWTQIKKWKIITLAQLPDFTEIEIDVELGYRKFTTWEEQGSILDKIKEMAVNPKQWFGIELLSVYTKLRPQDLLKLNEGDIELDPGMLYIHYPTKKKNQLLTIRLAPEHVEMFRHFKQKYPALPNVKFFRHLPGVSGVANSAPFGEKYFYKAWIAACNELGIEGLDLYGGTRHTTTTEIAKLEGKDAAKRHSGHRTNKAFNRYCQMDEKESSDMAQLVIKRRTRTEVLEFKKKAV
jgi:integrase